ncbi:hypothetical protein ACE6H2_026636 [Prunus campanulata]
MPVALPLPQNEDSGIRTAVLDVETVGHNNPLPRTTTVTRSGLGAARNRNRNENHPKLEEGVFLTWEDLWVTVVSKAKNENGSRSRSILQGVTGYARPGELLAIMGPSGCGKSTLLDALGGRLSSNTRKTGKILINGQKQALAYGTSAYVTQDDTLITTLTVSEAVYYSAQLQLPDSMAKAEKKERAEITIREMGLQDAMNTRIGGWGSKGLSGGQKRRVSICIELLTRPNLLFLDEPTSGLDSAASYYVMSRIANLDKTDGTPRTVITSIHQPSSEVFQLFDNLCLLSAGRTVYFGPASAANQFFSLCGFPCPTLQNPSDHFLKTINKDFEQDFGEELEKRSRAGFLTQSFVLTRRSFTNMYRDRGYYWLRLAVYITIALGLGSIYQDLGHSYESIQARGSLIMFVSSFLTFMAIGGFPSFVEDMKVFERERLNGHYGVSSFVFANTFSSVPFLILISVIPGAITYYVAGLHKGFEHFFYFACVLFACMMLVESLMMIVASIVPNFLMGIIAGAGIQGLMILCGGFFRLPNNIPKPMWKFPLYYIAFHKYAYQGLFKNEFIGTTFPSSDQGGKTSSLSGEHILRDIWQVEMGYSKWVDLAILVGMILLYRVLFLVIIKATEKVKIIGTTLLAMPFNNRSMQAFVNPSSPPVHGGKL